MPRPKITDLVILNRWRIHEACERNGKKLPDLAELLKVSSKTVYDWIRTGFPSERAREVAFWLGTTVEDLAAFMDIREDKSTKSQSPTL
jgi:hypothetical protein